MSGSSIALMIHLFGSFILIGAIWTAQTISLPLLKAVPVSSLKSFHQKYFFRNNCFMTPLMLFELVTGIIMILFPAEHIPRIPLLYNFSLIVLIWLATILFQIPIHQRLSFDPSVQDVVQLNRTNWIRTGLWSIKGGLLIWIVVEYQIFVETLQAPITVPL